MENAEQLRELVKKIMELAGGELRFKYQFNTPTELLAVGANNNAELARIEAIGADVPGRIWDLSCLLIAEVLPPDIIKNENPALALRQFLLDKVFLPKYGWEKKRQLAREAFSTGGFTEKQLAALYLLIDALPQMLIDEIVGTVLPLMAIPRPEFDRLTGILVEMFREARNADGK
jgi:hypothetical protein